MRGRPYDFTTKVLDLRGPNVCFPRYFQTTHILIGCEFQFLNRKNTKRFHKKTFKKLTYRMEIKTLENYDSL